MSSTQNIFKSHLLFFIYLIFILVLIEIWKDSAVLIELDSIYLIGEKILCDTINVIKPDSLLDVVPEDLAEVMVGTRSWLDHLLYSLWLEEYVVVWLDCVLEGFVC